MSDPICISDFETDDYACAVGVQRFALAMNKKLDRKRAAGRSGWNKPVECNIMDLYRLLRKHEAKGDHIDVANIRMMIWNRENPVAPTVDPEPAQ